MNEELGTAKMFVLLNEWARLYWKVEGGELTHREAFELFDPYARQFGLDVFMGALIAGDALEPQVETVKNRFGTIVI